MNFRALILYYIFFPKFFHIEILYCSLCSPISLCYVGKILEKNSCPPWPNPVSTTDVSDSVLSDHENTPKNGSFFEKKLHEMK